MIVKNLRIEQKEIVVSKGSMPDIDQDVSSIGRDSVKRYIEERYGINNVCSIGTYGTLKVKASLRDLCRLKGIPPQTMNYIAAMLEDSGDRYDSLFHDACKAPALKRFLQENSDSINLIPLILNQPKTNSIHAAGVIITPTDGDMTIYDWLPVKKMDGVLISEWEGPELEVVGFLKEDILGIKQLDKFTDIFKLIESNGGTPPDFESIDYNDQNVLDLFRRGLNQDLFHFGSVGLTSYSQDVKPDSIEELIAMIALYRPGAMEFGAHEDYVKIKFGKKQPEYDFGLEGVTKSTYGLYIFQEQIMKACQVLGGFSLVEADEIRKCVHEDTLFWTVDGYFPIKALQKKQRILTFSDIEIKNKLNSTNNVFSNGMRKCIRLVFKSGRELICTKDHEIYSDYGWMRADRCLKKRVLHECVEKYGTHVEEQAKLYLITALITEGSLNVKQSCFINKDPLELEAFRKAYEEIWRKSPKEYYNPYSKCTHIYIDKVEVEFLNIPFVKSKHKVLPDYFLRLNKATHLFVLGKLIDFDGGIDGNKICYYSKSKQLVDQIHFMFECLGVRAQLSKQYNKQYKSYYHTVYIADQKDIRIVYDRLSHHSLKIGKMNLDEFVNNDTSFSQYLVPHVIWYPIISNLIKNSGYVVNDLLCRNKMSQLGKQQNLTINRLKRILEICGRSKLLEFFITKQSYWDEVVKIEDLEGECRVFDFTMNYNCVPQAYANGLLVHNCMGKKLIDRIIVYRDRCIKSAVEKGCSNFEAIKIWSKLEAFAKYGFNRSHAAAYAMTGYFCQHLKYYFPMEFWTTSLQYADEDDIPLRIAEIRKLQNITILPPDINKSQTVFVADFALQTIYWSLGKIQFAGTIAINTIIEERNKNGDFFSLEEFIKRVPKRVVNKRVVINLILSGCFDQMCDVRMICRRSKILFDFYTLIGEIMPSEYNSKDEFFWFLKQRQVSGSGYFDYQFLLNDSKIHLAAQKYLTPNRILLSENVDCEGLVIGILTTVIEKTSSKGSYAQLLLDHNNERIEITVWNEIWIQYKSLLEQSVDKIILISGRVTWDKYKKHNVIYANQQTKIEIV